MPVAPPRRVDVRGPRSAACRLAADLPDADTGLCPGREMYLLVRRAVPARTA